MLFDRIVYSFLSSYMILFQFSNQSIRVLVSIYFKHSDSIRNMYATWKKNYMYIYTQICMGYLQLSAPGQKLKHQFFRTVSLLRRYRKKEFQVTLDDRLSDSAYELRAQSPVLQTSLWQIVWVVLVIGIDVIQYLLLLGERKLWPITLLLGLCRALLRLVFALSIMIIFVFISIQKSQRISSIIVSVHSWASSWILKIYPPHSLLFSGLPASTNLP